VGQGKEIDGGRVAVDFAMPFAMPPAGTYDAYVELSDGAGGAAHAQVGPEGELILASIRFTGPARIVFGDERGPGVRDGAS
jgi:hypothetical protein